MLFRTIRLIIVCDNSDGLVSHFFNRKKAMLQDNL
jgi:hypothetical protein